MRTCLVAVALLSLAACSSGASNSSGSQPAPEAPADTPGERPALDAEACAARGGVVVGDIGDGAIHRPDYKCPSGKSPIGTIHAAPGGPVAVEGSVCCPAK